MKRFISVLLVLTLLLALGVTALAAGSPTGTGKKNDAMTGFVVYNKSDKGIVRVPNKDIYRYSIHQADKLDAADQEAFKAAYEDAQKIEGKLVRNVFWLDIADEYKNMDDFSYVRYYFGLTGRNIKVSVNGKDMEVVGLGQDQYYAKLTEFGTVVITSG